MKRSPEPTLCTGCSHCDSGIVAAEAVLDFDDEDELEVFWSRHKISGPSKLQVTLSERGERHLAKIRDRSGQRKQRVTMMLDPQLKRNLEDLAASLGIGYQTLAQIYLAEAVNKALAAQGRAHERRSGLRAGSHRRLASR